MTRDRGRAGTGRAGKSSVRHRKILAAEKGRDPTPSEKHLHAHTHGHVEKSFVDEQSRIVHERSQEILHQQPQTQSDNDQCQAYYQAAGGVKKRRVNDLGSQAKCHYGPNLRASSGSDATSPATPLNVQSTPMGNLDELVMRLIPVLTDHMLPILIERVVEKGRDPTPSEKHLHVHTHGHAGKSFVGEQSQIVHERSQEILHQQTKTYQAAEGGKKRRVYGHGSQAKYYYGPNLCTSSGSDATSPVTPLNVQSTPTWNLDELVMRVIPALTDQMLPILIERVRGLISSRSHQLNTLTNHPSVEAPTVPAALTTANIDEVHASVSDDDYSPASH